MVETRILHYPQLDTVLLVENLIRAEGEVKNKTILDYLEYSGKIYMTRKGEIIWVYNPERIKKMIKENLVIR